MQKALMDYETAPHIIEYPRLMDTAQLSAARLADIHGSIQAHSFAEILSQHDESEHDRITCEVGARFDDALINFVTASLIGRRNQDVVILAEASEGINGYFPWEPLLHERVETLHAHGILTTVNVRVERYSTDDQDIQALTEEAQALAIETTPEYHHA